MLGGEGEQLRGEGWRRRGHNAREHLQTDRYPICIYIYLHISTYTYVSIQPPFPPPPTGFTLFVPIGSEGFTSAQSSPRRRYGNPISNMGGRFSTNPPSNPE